MSEQLFILYTSYPIDIFFILYHKIYKINTKKYFMQQIRDFTILISEKTKTTRINHGGVIMTAISAISLIVLTFGVGWLAVSKTENIIP